MGRPQPEPSLYEDVGATEVSQLATEWRERLGWSHQADEDEPPPDPAAEQPQVTLGEEPSHRLIPAVGHSRMAPHGPELLPAGDMKSSLPGVAAFPAPGAPRQSQKIALVPASSRVSPEPEPPLALARPSRQSKQLPSIQAQGPGAAPPSRTSGQLIVAGLQRRSGPQPAAPSRISGVLPELAPPPRSSDPSLPGSAMSLRRSNSESSKSIAVAPKDAHSAQSPKTLVLALAGVAVLSLAANALSLFRGSGTWRTAPTAASVAAAPPAAVHAAAASSAPAVAACLRESTQTITSEERDDLLLRAVQAFENGKRDQASSLFQRYVHEACDAATLEAVAILNQQREPSPDGKGASR